MIVLLAAFASAVFIRTVIIITIIDFFHKHFSATQRHLTTQIKAAHMNNKINAIELGRYMGVGWKGKSD